MLVYNKINIFTFLHFLVLFIQFDGTMLPSDLPKEGTFL